LKDNTAILSDGTEVKGTHAIGKHEQIDGDNSYSRVYAEVETLTGQIVDN
jgi:hypothetical protein